MERKHKDKAKKFLQKIQSHLYKAFGENHSQIKSQIMPEPKGSAINVGRGG